MSDEQTPPPPLRLKPRLRPADSPANPVLAPAEPAPPAAVEVPAAVALPSEPRNDADGPRIRLRPRLMVDGATAAVAQSNTGEPARTEAPAERPAPTLPPPPVLFREDPPAPVPPPAAVVPPAVAPAVSQTVGEAEGGLPSAPVGGTAGEVPKFKLKPKPSAPPPSPVPVVGSRAAVPPAVAPAPSPVAVATPPVPAPIPPVLSPAASAKPSVPPVGKSTPAPFPVVAAPPSPNAPPPVAAPPPPPPMAAAPMPATAKPARSRVVVFGGLAALLLLGGGFFAWQTFLVEPPPPPAPAKPKPAAAATPAPGSISIGNVPAAAVKKAEAALAARAAGGASDVDAALANEPAKEATPGDAPVKAAAPAAVATTGVTHLSPGISATTALHAAADAAPAFRSFVANAKISGVVGGGGGRSAAALINGRLTRVGDVLDAPLGVTLEAVDVEKRQLVFKDRSGATVARRY